MSEKKDLTFPELQRLMQLEKQGKQGISFTYRNAEQIYTKFKELNSGWIVLIQDELLVIQDRLFVKSTVTARKGDETYSSTAFAEHNTVPVFKNGNKQMQEPQWTGTVSSYARKYALQGLFAIGEKDVDDLSDEMEQGEGAQQNSQTQFQGSPQQAQQGINNNQHNQILNGIRRLAQVTGRTEDELIHNVLNHFKIQDFHQVPVEHFGTVMNYLNASLAKAQGMNDFNNL